MTSFGWCTVLVLAFGAAIAQAAERGIYTLVEGDARVLRGATWYTLAPGVRAEEGDVVDVGERAQAQLEFAQGGALNMQGPALAHAVALPASGDKAGAPVEIALERGWFKAAAAPKARAVRLRLPNATVDLDDAIAVVHGDAALAEVFLERGGARIAVPVARGKEAPPRNAKEGEFWRRAGDRAFSADERAPADFVAAMPRDLREALPALAGRYTGPAPVPAAAQPITFDEARPWLAGPMRRIFARRFMPRLSDPAFRAAAAAHPIPEWDRILHPEKYRPKPPDETPASAAAAR